MRIGGRKKRSEIVQRLVEIGAVRLQEDAGIETDQSRIIMREVAHNFCDEYGGAHVYLPRDVELPLEKRDKAIWDAYTGDNTQELARRFGLTERQVRYIIKLMRHRAVELNQIEIPGLDTP
ncbi:Mor transcription activator family protein [Sphaerotilus sp.]|uniref:Mor transcription activator family protein n=1 Tax=Sphaerotilus sp. TaxID=2093942 RepID=UPI00286D8E09|nr:Mor transcription activator family protein [Sphaerotilus sp.]